MRRARGVAEQVVVRIVSRLLAVGALAFAGLTSGEIVTQGSGAVPGWSLIAVVGVFGPPIALGLLGSGRRPRATRAVALAGVVGTPLVMASIPVVLGPTAGGAPWPLQLTAFGTTCAALVLRPVFVVIDIAVSSGLVVLVRALASSVSLGPIPTQDGLCAALICSLFAALTVGALSGGTSVDAAAGAALTEALAEDRSRIRAVEQTRVDAVTHDLVLSTLTAASRSPAVSPRLARSAADALTRLEEMQSDPPSDDRVPFAVFADRLAAEGHAIAPATALGVSVDRDGSELPLGVAEALLGAAAEALRNSMEHAPSAGRTTSVVLRGRSVEVRVTDGGPGFDPARVPADRLGRRGSVVGRMHAVGGAAEVRSSRRRGTEILLRWPA